MEFNEKLLKEEYFFQALSKIKEIVKIPSYAQPPTKAAPYGPGIAAVLQLALKLGQELCFKTYCDDNNKYGYIEYGSGTEIFAILGHLDVVPPGNLEEWKVPPFEPQIVNDILYGRGVLDDKGPIIIILFCLKYLKDHNYQPNRRIRIIFGLTEETTWDSINTYMKKEGMPTFGFTPDGMFPLVYAEKGILDVDIIGQGNKKITVNGGVAYNVTCATCVTTGINNEAFLKIGKKRQYRLEEKAEKVIIHGIAAHGSRPNDGINAGLRTLLILNELHVENNLVAFVSDILQEDITLNKYFNKFNDESGNLTINVGIVNINSENSKIGCNIRIPVKTDAKKIIAVLEKMVAPYGLIVKEKQYEKPLYMPQNSTIIVELMKIYQAVTNDQKAVPIAIGGGTYARAMANCVAFGAIFNHNNSTEHQYNECIRVDDLWKAMLIYVRAINKLGSLEKY